MPTGLAARRATRFRPSPRSGYATFPLVFPLKVDQVTSRIPLQFQADVRRYRTTLDGAPADESGQPPVVLAVLHAWLHRRNCLLDLGSRSRYQGAQRTT